VSSVFHLQASQRVVAQLSNEERIDWIRQERWIQYPRAKRILERLAELVDYPPRHRMLCLAIYGSTGLREELQRHPHLTLQLAWEEYR
jgi:TniB protein